MFSFFKRKRKVINSEPINDLKKNNIPEIAVNILENLIIIDIKDSCSITDYCEYIKSINCEYLFKKIWNSTIWDSNKQEVSKNKIYYTCLDNAEYNIYNNDTKLFIVERRTISDESLWVDEICLTINKNTCNYQIARLKHDETRSTFYTKFYNSAKEEDTLFYLEHANDLALEMLERLNIVCNIDKIINIEEIKLIIKDNNYQLIKRD